MLAGAAEMRAQRATAQIRVSRKVRREDRCKKSGAVLIADGEVGKPSVLGLNIENKRLKEGIIFLLH